VIEDDSELFQRALDDANVPVLPVDPVSQVFLRFERDLDLVRAAADLGTTAEGLRNDINDLNPVLEVVVPIDGLDPRSVSPRLDRDDFTNLYLESLCVLLLPAENQPDPVLCDEVLQ
jgi:hypothetical protein